MNRLTTLAAALLAALAFPAAGEPQTAAIDQRRVCLECHDLEAELAARVPHAPAAAGECSACHNPHVSRFDALLLAQPGPLCANCHGEISEQLARDNVHAPAAEGRCAECHPPHGASVAGLLSAPAAELCQRCHGEVAEWKQRRVAHAPFARGRCADCHEAHASTAPHLIKAAAACTSCHAADARFRSLHGGYPVERAPCTTCHDPHASDRAGLLRQTVHEPFAAGDCSTCHVAAGDRQPFALIKPQAELCGDCHVDQVEESLRAPFAHVSAGGGRCTDCHNPHAGEGEGLLQRRGDATCLACHDPGGASSGQPGRHTSHAADVGCSTCHAPHGSERPLMFVGDPVQVCSECHSHQHGVSHPMGEASPDPRSGVPMDCGSCHGIHYAPYPSYLHASEVRDLCVSCHKDMARRRR